MVSNVLLVVYYVPDLGTDAPNWIYFSFAAGLWLYSTFDNVDGKQARRTGTSSPLGELFDHGCDALNTAFVSILQCAALGLGHTQNSLIIFITTVFGFYMSTAEEYYTKVLYLGVVNGPTEGILLTCFAFIWSGFNGKIYNSILCVNCLIHQLWWGYVCIIRCSVVARATKQGHSICCSLVSKWYNSS